MKTLSMQNAQSLMNNGANKMTVQISDVISGIESGGNIYAARYEPQWRYLTDAMISETCKIHKCSIVTARMLLSTSWGKYQIMGAVLFELGYRQRIIPDFFHPQMQEVYFSKYLASRKISNDISQLLTEEGRRFFATKYNGNGAVQQYADKIKSALINIGMEVK
jgi:muramidase (phage lysozyme)